MAFVLLAAGCTATPKPAGDSDKTFNRLAAIEMFATGYTQISEKFIEPVSVDRIALEGVRGLSVIDPSLVVTRAGPNIKLVANDNEIARFQAPPAQEVAAWSSLTTDVWRAARDASPTLKRTRPEKVYEAIFDGTLSTLDTYSRYAGRKQALRNRSRRDGFGGIGVRFRLKGAEIHVYKVLKNTPAERAGLKRGDIITHVGDVPLKGSKPRDVVSRLRGPLQSVMTITIKRPGAPRAKTFEIERTLIVPDTVFPRIENGVLYLRIKSFNQKTTERTAKHVRAALAKERLKGIILDLRGNPGGLLKQSIKVADLFIKRGSIVTTQGRHPDSFQYYEAEDEDITGGLPLAVLVDGKSASAAEVLAAALQDSGRAVLIGTTSYGKGTVQTVLRLPNDGEITLTWSRLHAPAGYVFHNLGVFPTVCTSGAEKRGAAAVLRAALKRQARTMATLNAWRLSKKITDEKRPHLREICAPERRRKDVEIEIAHSLLGDRALYARAMMTGPAIAETPPP